MSHNNWLLALACSTGDTVCDEVGCLPHCYVALFW